MYGKHFASTYTGSMFGAGPYVFAVWGYVIANTVDSHVELNPTMLSAVIGTPEKNIIDAIAYLSAPDPKSRNKIEDGRRIVKEDFGFIYRVPTHEHYRNLRNEADRREYMKDYMRKRRSVNK